MKPLSPPQSLAQRESAEKVSAGVKLGGRWIYFRACTQIAQRKSNITLHCTSADLCGGESINLLFAL